MFYLFGNSQVKVLIALFNQINKLLEDAFIGVLIRIKKIFTNSRMQLNINFEMEKIYLKEVNGMLTHKYTWISTKLIHFVEVYLIMKMEYVAAIALFQVNKKEFR